MNNKSFGILAIGGGVILLYVAYTGRLQSVWNGILGQCDCHAQTTASPGSGSAPILLGSGPQNGQSVGPGFGIGLVRGQLQQAGDGGFQPSRQYLSRGAYNVSATGGIRVSDAGQA